MSHLYINFKLLSIAQALYPNESGFSAPDPAPSTTINFKDKLLFEFNLILIFDKTTLIT